MYLVCLQMMSHSIFEEISEYHYGIGGKTERTNLLTYLLHGAESFLRS